MRHTLQRSATRSQAWPETEAYIKFIFPNGNQAIKHFKAFGHVIDIGSCGMFLKTEDFIPVSTNLEITICFDSNADTPDLSINARGQAVRSCREGVGIRFTSINLVQLQKCLIAKINKMHQPIKKPNQLDETRI